MICSAVFFSVPCLGTLGAILSEARRASAIIVGANEYHGNVLLVLLQGKVLLWVGLIMFDLAIQSSDIIIWCEDANSLLVVWEISEKLRRIIYIWAMGFNTVGILLAVMDVIHVKVEEQVR